MIRLYKKQFNCENNPSVIKLIWEAFVRRKIMLFSLALILITLPILYLVYKYKPKAEAAWWDETWLYRKAVNITNSSGENLTDFQVSFTLDTASLISSGKMQSDCDDIRITDSQGNLLPHWIEENNPGCNNSATKIWTKVPSLPTSGATVYVYYGNSSATNTQNGENVFEFFDDFETGYLDTTNKWNIDEGSQNSIEYYDGSYRLKINSETAIVSKNRSWSTYVYEGDMRINTFNYPGLIYNSYQEDYYYDVYWSNGERWRHYGGIWTRSSETGLAWTPTANTWYTFKLVANNNNISMYFYLKSDGSLKKSAENISLNSSYNRGGVGFIQYQSSALAYFDNIRVRKYASTEPSSSLSSEEQSPGPVPVAYWKFDEGTGTTVYDSTANGNNGTISGATWQTEDMCVVGKCLYFDGSDDVVTISNSVGNIKTVSFWVKPITTSEQFIDLNGSAYIQSSSGTISATGFTNPTIYVNGKASTTIEANKWQHVVMTTNTAVSGSAVKIAQISSNFGQVFVDEVKLYPYARSAAQVLADYNAGKAKAASSKGVAVNLGAPKDASAGFPSSLSEGLVGYWKMDESSWTNDCSTSTVIDYSGNGNHGKSCPSGSGSQPTTGKFGNAGNFDGTDDYVLISHSNSLYLTDAVSIVGWFRWNGTGEQAIISKTKDTSVKDYDISTANGKLTVWYESTGYDQYISSNSSLSSSVWTHFVVVFDNRSSGKIYINGALDKSFSSAELRGVTTQPHYIGKRGTGYLNAWFNGLIDEVRIYNRALSPAEVRALYEWAPGPVAHFKLDDGQGTSPIDSSGFSRTGSIINGIWSIGKFGKGLKLDGSGDYLEITDF